MKNVLIVPVLILISFLVLPDSLQSAVILTGATRSLREYSDGGSPTYDHISYDLLAYKDVEPGFYKLTRAFVELDLNPWYDLGLSVDSITKITFSSVRLEFAPSTDQPLNIYEMTTGEDGIIDVSATQFYSGTNIIRSNIPATDYKPYLTFELTGADLHFITDDISASRLWTGISIGFTDESVSALGLDTVMFGGGDLATLEIQYNAEPVPEPSVMLFFGSGFLWLLRKKQRQR